MRLIVDSEITCEDVPVEVEDDCVAQLVIPNPVYEERKKQDRWIPENLPKELRYIKIDGNTLKGIPSLSFLLTGSQPTNLQTNLLIASCFPLK